MAVTFLVYAGCGGRSRVADAKDNSENNVSLQVSLSPGGGEAVQTATLTCSPQTAEKSGFLTGDTAELCAKATEMAKFLASQPRRDRICAQIYSGPETAHITGRIGSLTIDRKFSRRNSCETADWNKVAPLLGGIPSSGT